MNTYDFAKYIKVTSASGDQIKGHSPFREDRNPSFSANINTGLWKDFGTGESGNWDQFLNRFEGQDMKSKSRKDFWDEAILVATYQYLGSDAKPLLRVERYENNKRGEKRFLQKHLENGNWKNGKPNSPVGPYRYTEWQDTQECIFFVEGEKCAEALIEKGLKATTTPGGANIRKFDHLTDYFKDKIVCVIPDNDEVGRQYALNIAKIISPACKSLKIVNLDNLKEGEDLVEWLGNGGTIEALHKLHELTPVFSTETSSSQNDKFGEFSELLELPPLLPKAPTLNSDQIPEPFRAWVGDVAERLTISQEFILFPALVGLGSLVGRKIAVRPKKYDPWWEVMNLWGMLVGSPSVLKSPALNEALDFLQKINKRRYAKFSEEKKEAEPKLAILKVKEKAWIKQLNKAISEDGDTKEIETRIKETQDEIKKITPVFERIITNDTTVEKLSELLIQNPNGILIFRDELSGWLSNLTKQGREGDRELYLESWNGKNSYCIDRILRGSQYVPALRVAIIGGIQPSKLSSFIGDIVRGGSNADGLFDRFQLAVFPEKSAWQLIDRKENQAAKQRASDIFETLLDANFCGHDLETVDGIPALRFSSTAQLLFNEWISKLENQLRSPEVNNIPYLESHLGKYRSLMPKLAALIELIYWADNCRLAGIATNKLSSISKESAILAIELCTFLEAHAKKIYSIASEPGCIEAHELAKHIKNGEIVDGETVRNIARHHWKHLVNVEKVELGLSVLEKYHWVKIKDLNSGKIGRPSEAVFFNPELKL